MKIRTTDIFRSLCLLGYFGLIINILIWNAWLSPPSFPVAIVLFILLTPLLFALKGLLEGRRYTYAWCSLCAIFYFVLGVGDAYSDPVDRVYGIAMVVASTMFFTGAIIYVRLSRVNP